MRSRSVIDEIRVSKTGLVSVILISPDDFSRQPKVVAEYGWPNDITDLVRNLCALLAKKDF
jgi:hypothetical protein